MTNNKLWRAGKWAASIGLALTVTFGSIAPLMAQEIAPEMIALARKYIDLTNKQGIYEVLLVQTAQQTSKLLSQQNPDVADKIDAAIGKILETYKGKNDELFNQLARVYATQFTQEELQQIVDFYSSPAGQKLASSQTELSKGMQAVLRVYTYNFGTEFVTKVRAELNAEGYKF